jgi:hypothetical protein
MRSSSILVCVIAFTALAGFGKQADAQALTSPSQWFLSVDLGVASTTPAARFAGLGAGGELNISGGRRVSRFLHAGLDLGVVFFDDSLGFSNETTGGTKQSSTSGITGSAWIGLTTAALSRSEVRRVDAAINIGMSYLNVSREIGDCIDCDSESLASATSLFVEPLVLINFAQGKQALRLSVRQNVSSGYFVDRVVRVGWLVR